MRRLIVENAFTGERTEIDLDENLTFREALIWFGSCGFKR